jgi:hypothetical protein
MLRYKNHQLVAKPELVDKNSASPSARNDGMRLGTVEEVGTIKEVGARMEERGCLGWWRVKMGFASDDG